MDITWAELEPEEGIYDWTSIEQENQLARWQQEGKHLILRFVCDIPGEERHMDIPKWLYEKTGEAGTWYDGEYGKGFAPDYNNAELIACHAKAVEALGTHFGTDGLVAYVELGSLGHWGEWHVNYEEMEPVHAKGESPGTVYHSMDPGVPEGKAADAQAVPCGQTVWNGAVQ